MGATIALNLVKSKQVEQVTVYDVDRHRLSALTRGERSSKLAAKVHDVRRRRETVESLKKADVGIGALPHGLSEYAIHSAIDARVNFIDLIFGWRFGQAEINAACKRRGITIIPACGLAPGLLRKARIIKNRRIVDVPPLSGLEIVNFPAPVGKCECFYTDGLSTLVQTIRKVREMDEKTIRWPGHAEQIKTLIDCGLLATKPVTYHNLSISPREFVSKALSEKLALGEERDLTLLRVEVSGRKNGKKIRHRYQMIDHYDIRRGITSMARTTAFPCSIAAEILALGRIRQKGLVPPEIAFKGDLRDELLGYVAARGMDIESKFI